MNIQAMMKQAQKLQKEMMEEKEKIDKKEFIGKSSLVTVIITGDKKVQKVNIQTDKMEKEDIEALEDMITVAFNDVMNQVDKETEEKMSKYTQGMPGLF